jgi:hypothetical protein
MTKTNKTFSATFGSTAFGQLRIDASGNRIDFNLEGSYDTMWHCVSLERPAERQKIVELVEYLQTVLKE